MPSNREWLNDLAANDPQKLNTWFEAEYVDVNELKAKAEQAERAMNAAAGKWARADAELRESNPENNLGQSQDSEIDSREKLRKDIINYTLDAYNGCWLIDVDTIDEWLDRQAAITERECRCKRYEDGYVRMTHEQYDGLQSKADERDFLAARVDELNTQVQELQIEREKLREKVRNQTHQLSDVQDALERRNKGEFKKRWYKQIDELKSQNINLAHDLGECMADRDKFRSEISEMLDAAQQIERIRAKHETQSN